MQIIQLNGKWELGEQINGGGFGRIYRGTGVDGKCVAVKLIPKAPGAARELLFVSIPASPNVLPVLDSGEWEQQYVLVMPFAEKSLRQHLEESSGKLPIDEAVAILKDIAEALASLSPDVVHRDLKPENILSYNGSWCVADFGIARYAEATTAPDTHKYSMTPPYAALEQWRGERATQATDVYALGVMAFEILQGKRPFQGPDYRDQHMNQAPPTLVGCPPTLASLVQECLFKSPSARPTTSNILSRLEALCKSSSVALARLQAANKNIVQEEALRDAANSAQKSNDEQRAELVKAAEQVFRQLMELIRDRALEAAPSIRTSTVSSERGFTLKLGAAALIVDSLQRAPQGCLGGRHWEPCFDVVAYSSISVRKSPDPYGYEGRAHSLWFCDAHEEGVYRWFELAFMIHPAIPQSSSIDPFSITPIDELASEALAPIHGARQLAWDPIPVDQGEEDKFVERWLTWFAEAADGSLRRPGAMPEQSGGGFRKAGTTRR